MAVPDFQTLMLPLLRLASDGQEHSQAEAVERLSDQFALSPEDRAEQLGSGQTRVYNRVAWASTYLRKAGLLRSVGLGRFQLTQQGSEVLQTPPPKIDIAFLEANYPEVAEFRRTRTTDAGPAEVADGRWILRADLQDRLQATLYATFPDEATRHSALALLAFAIEEADADRPDSWLVKETGRGGLALMTGRVQACRIERSKIYLSIIGPLDEEDREAIGADKDDDGAWSYVPDGLTIRFPTERAGEALRRLSDSLGSFIELVMARVRSAVTLDEHLPESVGLVSQELGRDLPQPTITPSEPDEADTDDEETTPRQPRVRGRAPIFEYGQRQISSLLSDIERRVIVLPDLQRPFVWEDTQTRDLLDSLFLGFPIGTLVFWHTSDEKQARAVGGESVTVRAPTLVIDGQQRLTSLYAVMRGEEIVDKDGRRRRLMIAFRPRDGRFEVADAAIRRDPEYLPDVSQLWSGKQGGPQIRKALLTALRDSGKVVDDLYEEAAEANIDRARSLSEYRLPTVDIRRGAAGEGAEATEEDVANIFVRINNQGTRLRQADFVLTLLSVFHGELRDTIEERSRTMSQGAVVSLDAQQLLRAACAVAFGRARMSAVYRYLRGIDPITGEADPAGRAARLRQLDDAARECVETIPWRDYLLCVRHAGFVTPALVASRNAVVNAYAFYVKALDGGVRKPRTDEVIARWVFGSLLTARYSTSSETVFEADLGRWIRAEASGVEDLERVLDDLLGETLTGDFWTRSLVAALDTQKSRAPAALAFRAAQIVLGARALFSSHLLQNLLESRVSAGRAASEVHHLFPEAWLRGNKVTERRDINQVGNLADVGWHQNTVIGARSPSDYVPRIRESHQIDDQAWARQCAEHALPPGWENMEYRQFLSARRQRMAELIRAAFRKLGGEADAAPLEPPWFVGTSEAAWRRIAEAERGLRNLVRMVYSRAFGAGAAQELESVLGRTERESLTRALRSRPPGTDPLSVVDYLYLAQLPSLLFADKAWPTTKAQLGSAGDAKQRLQKAIEQIAPVRNEIAHVREVAPDRLLRATAACSDVLEMLRVALDPS